MADPAEAQPAMSSHEREVFREGTTMALYISLSLLAVIAVSPDNGRDTRVEVATTMFVTAAGLLAAHVLAFTISSRLVNGTSLGPEARRVLWAQIVAGLLVVLLATIPTLIFDPAYSLHLASGLLVLLVAVVGFRAAVHSGASTARALGYVAIILMLAMAVLAIKTLTGH